MEYYGTPPGITPRHHTFPPTGKSQRDMRGRGFESRLLFRSRYRTRVGFPTVFRRENRVKNRVRFWDNLRGNSVYYFRLYFRKLRVRQSAYAYAYMHAWAPVSSGAFRTPRCREQRLRYLGLMTSAYRTYVNEDDLIDSESPVGTVRPDEN